MPLLNTMSKFRQFRFALNSLRVQLLLWIALPVAVSLLGISLIEIRGHEGAMTQLVQQQTDLVARAMVALIEAHVADRQHRLEMWADEYVEGVPPPFPVQTAFAAGTMALPLVDLQIAPGWGRSEPLDALANHVRSTQNPTMTTLFDADSGQWLFVQAVPVSAITLVGAEPITTLVASEIVATLEPSQLDEVRILLPTGELLFNKAVTDHTPSDADHAAHADNRWVVSRALIPSTGWQVEVWKDWRDLVPPLLNFGNAALFIVIVAVVLSFFSAYFGLRTIVWPLQRLNQEVSQVGWGDFLAIKQPVGGVAEIEELRYVLARMTEQIRQYQNELQSYIGAMTFGQEEERRRLARELHDDTVQNLIALNHQVEMVERDLARDPKEASLRLQGLRPLVTATIDDLRRQIFALRPMYLEDLGLIPALESLVQQVCQRHNLKHRLELTGETEVQVAVPLQISTYRIAQEALQNVVKHAQASQVEVALHIEVGSLRLRIKDDGCGFAVPNGTHHLAQEGHFGLVGMKERAQLHGGTLTLESQLGKGTTISVYLPFHEERMSRHTAMFG